MGGCLIAEDFGSYSMRILTNRVIDKKQGTLFSGLSTFKGEPPLMRRTQIILIDSHLRRRASVAFEMTDLLSYVLPLEDVGELCSIWPEEAVILVEDTRDNLSRLARMMRREQRELPFIAFSAAPAQPARSRARRLGAADYLAWPSEVSLIHQTVMAAQATRTPPEIRAAKPARDVGAGAGKSAGVRGRRPIEKVEPVRDGRVVAISSTRDG